MAKSVFVGGHVRPRPCPVVSVFIRGLVHHRQSSSWCPSSSPLLSNFLSVFVESVIVESDIIESDIVESVIIESVIVESVIVSDQILSSLSR